MDSKHVAAVRPRTFRRALVLFSIAILALAWTASASAQSSTRGVAVPGFTKSFVPATIGPGSTTTLKFDITNNDPANSVGNLAFIDNLPASVTIATPAQALSDCGGTLSAPEGSATISLSNGVVAAGATCSIFVDVTSSTPGVHMNDSGDLTSDLGNSGPASADLTVATDRPGFTKSFAPGSVALGGRSTLTFTIDNSANASNAVLLAFADELPASLEVAAPANVSNTCSLIPGTVVATPGSDSIAYSGGGVAAGASCAISVDVVATGIGRLDNTSDELTSSATGFPILSSGKASAVLTATADALAFQKAFVDDPAPPGSSTTLEFTITNFDRNFSASDIGFTDDLDATLAGLVATGLPVANVCGTGSEISGTSLLTLTGGALAPGASCTFSVTLQVPAGAMPGAYPNATSAITGDVDGSPVVGAAATDTLFVDPVPILTKTFLDDPTAAGNVTRLEFTLTNTSTTASASDLGFTDVFDVIFPTASAVPLSECCGTGSTCTFFPLANPPPPSNSIPAQFNLTNGVLAPGDSCTFEITLDVSPAANAGTYTNTTSDVTATVDGDNVVGSPASAELEVVAAPMLTKEFTDDPALPGSAVTLEFTLTHDELAPGDATDITFTDDLGAALSGLAALALPQNDICGPGSQISGTSTLTFTGGTLAPGASCNFSVTLQVPAAAPSGEFTNTTSDVTADIVGLTATGLPAEDTLTVAAVRFSKEFIDDPAIPGGLTTLRFTIENSDATSDATGLFFTDNLGDTIPGLAAQGLPQSGICGAGSQISGSSGNSFLTFTGGNLTAGTSCAFDVVLDVPAATANDLYGNTTSNLTGSLGGDSFVLPPATDDLFVDNNLLTLSKAFTDDPVEPGDTVTLEFTVTNLDANNAASNITFTDDLDAALAGLAAVGLPAVDVCGAGSQISGTSLLTLTGGSLPAGAACTFSVTLQVPAAVPLGTTAANTTSDVTGTITGLPVQGPPASDLLLIQNVSFTKSFDGPTTATGTPVLTFTLSNLSATAAVSGLEFLDDLEAFLPGLVATGLPASGVCGAGSEITGTSTLSFTGGALGPGETCNVSVNLIVPPGTAPGGYLNTTSALLANGLLAATPASASLQVEPPPGFGKVFFPNAIAVDGTSTLTFTVNNGASAVAANSLAFGDNLPGGLSVADPPNAASTCGGSVTAVAGASNVGFSGGSVAAGGTCTIQVDITGTAEGNFVNISEALNSTSGNSGTATDSIDVVSGDFVVTKSFRTAPVLPAGLVEMEISIVNGSAFPLTDVSLSDDLTAALGGLAAEGLPLTDVCGTGSQISGTSTVVVTGGNLAPGASCTIVISVRVPAGASAGTYVNTTSTASGTREGVPVEADPDSADLVVEPLGFVKSFDPALVPVGGTTTATFQITNPDPANAVTGLTFSDDLDAFVPGMTAANTPIADACGAGSLVSGSSAITLTDGSVAAGGSCTIQVVLSVPADTVTGNYTNTTSELTSTAGDTQTSAATASAVLGVQPLPSFAKAFSPDVILPRESSTLTFTIDNGDSQLDAELLAFVDNLPAGMAVADSPAVANTCGGTLTAAPGSGLIELTGGSVTAGSICQIQVDVTINSSGTFTNVTEDLTSNLGNSGSATAIIRVEQALAVPLLDIRWLAMLALVLGGLGLQAMRRQTFDATTSGTGQD